MLSLRRWNLEKKLFLTTLMYSDIDLQQTMIHCCEYCMICRFFRLFIHFRLVKLIYFYCVKMSRTKLDWKMTFSTQIITSLIWLIKKSHCYIVRNVDDSVILNLTSQKSRWWVVTAIFVVNYNILISLTYLIYAIRLAIYHINYAETLNTLRIHLPCNTNPVR